MGCNESDEERTEGAASPHRDLDGSTVSLDEGTPSQLEWAERIKRNVDAEFDRVAASFRAVGRNQSRQKREETEMVLTILEDKRAEVMAIRRAGYFIKFWQEITDQVRQMIFHDPRYETIKNARESQRSPNR